MLEGLYNKMLAQLAINKIISLNDFAELSTYDLIDKKEGILKDFVKLCMPPLLSLRINLDIC